MSTELIAYTGATIFDGHERHHCAALVVDGRKIARISDQADLPPGCRRAGLAGGLIAPGLVDLQVNGGGGEMLNNTPDVGTIRTICDAHCRSGTTSLLPTLITYTPEQMTAAIQAAKEAVTQDVPGIIGLHLEGPHLSVVRKGAHDPALIRVMDNEDCARLEKTAADLPSLLITIAPEAVSNEQIRKLSLAGAIVSLGHTDANFATAMAAAQSGATCVTHLFNAMSQLENREPGVVGAALYAGSMFAGLIADGIHVNSVNISIALRAKQGPGKLFLISDAMATIGSNVQEFSLNGRTIRRRDGCLALPDGTLAGADLDMISAVRFMVNNIGLSQDEALRMAALYPAQLLRRTSEFGCLAPGTRADFIHLDDDIQLLRVWRGGVCNQNVGANTI